MSAVILDPGEKLRLRAAGELGRASLAALWVGEYARAADLADQVALAYAVQDVPDDARLWRRRAAIARIRHAERLAARDDPLSHPDYEEDRSAFTERLRGLAEEG